MNPYKDKTFGRNDEVAAVFKHFEANRDLSMHGPRRLGKSFLLDRVVDESGTRGWVAIKVEIAGCPDTRSVFRELCSGISTQRSASGRAFEWVKQRMGQFVAPRSDSGGTWYKPFIDLDHESYLERLIKTLHEDPSHRWALLIDELPIFLKVLHDKSSEGVTTARNFMNLISQLRQKYPKVRWMITGSIGIAPLAQAGNYMGVLAKFANFDLHPLSTQQAKDLVKYLATSGQLEHRSEITETEAEALVSATGWRAAYYLDALARKVAGPLCNTPEDAERLVETAIQALLSPLETSTFGTSEEHLRKHYEDGPRAVAFAVLGALAKDTLGRDLDGLLTQLQRPMLTREGLRQIMMRLDAEGFVSVDNWNNDSPNFIFRNPLLRRWWNRFPPQSAI